MRRIARASLALIVTVLAILLVPGSASAIDGPDVLKPPCKVADDPGCTDGSGSLTQDNLSCKKAPTPALPGRGLTGFFVRPPEALPDDEDPFAKGANVSIYEVYGYAGLTWNTYDLGCGPDLARDPGASVGTTVANWVSQWPQSWNAMTSALIGEAYEPTFLGVFDPLVSRSVEALKVSIFEKYAWLVMGAFGLMMIVMSRRQQLSTSAGAIGWALLVMVMVTMVFRWPLVAGHAADESMSSVMAQVNSGLNGGDETSAGDALAGNLHKSLLYDTWLAGTFGSATSATAKKYGPQIFEASALTWREAAIAEADVEEGKKITGAKKERFVKAAEAIKAEDPDAYTYLTGERSEARVGYAFLSLFGTLFAIPFLIISGILILASLIIVRFGVMLFPAFATLGLFPTMRALVTGLVSMVAAALINAAVFGGAVSVMILAMGVAMTSGSPGWLTIVIMLILSIVFWCGLKPFRKLTRMVSADDMKSAAGEAVSAPVKAGKAVGAFGLKAATAIAASGAGVAAGSIAADHIREQAVPQRAEGDSDQVRVTTQVVSREPNSPGVPLPRSIRATRAHELPATGPDRPRDDQGPAPTAPKPTGPRPGDDGQPVEGVVLPPVRFETEDA